MSIRIGSLAVLALAAVAVAQSPQVAEKRLELEALRQKATVASKEIKRLSAETDLTSSDEAVRLLKRYVDELTEVRERLARLEEELQTLEGVRKDVQTLQTDVSKLKKTTVFGMLQLQYQDTNRIGTSQFDAFRIRRSRLGISSRIDPKLTLRMQGELAAGTNSSQWLLKDLFATWDVAETATLTAGQFSIPLGFEIARSDFDREMPERALYNTTYFAGERSRGLLLRQNFENGFSAWIGGMNSLSTEDAEQSGLPSGPGNKLAVHGGVRSSAVNHTLGLSAYVGERPAFTSGAATSPEVDRHFIYVDGELRNVLTPGFYLRAEAMTGKDRVPSSTAAATKVARNLTGFQVQAGYLLNPKNQLNFRWEQLDPDTGSGGNVINGYGLGLKHRLSPDSQLVLAHEIFEDQGRISIGQVRYHQTTLRLNVRF